MFFETKEKIMQKITPVDRLLALKRDIFGGGWYIRIWIAVWIVGFILALVASGILMNTSVEAGKEDDWVNWIENRTSLGIQFPIFDVRPEALDESIGVIACTYLGVPVDTVSCPGGGAVAQCARVLGNTITATLQGDITNPTTLPKIDCDIMTNNDNNTAAMISVKINGDMGPDTLWLAPNEDAWVNLQQIVVQPLTSGKQTKWRKQLVYHSTVMVAGHYTLSFHLSDFLVFHFDQIDSYDGWMSASDIGGFAFFMVVIHALALFSASIFFDDDSSFLKPNLDDSGRN